MSEPVVYFHDVDCTWDQALTFEDWIVKMVLEGKTKEDSFQAALRVYGRERIEKIWRDHKAQKASDGEK
jgi:hypothetical protein